MKWLTLSLEEKTEYEELINSDLLFSLMGYFASFPEDDQVVAEVEKLRDLEELDTIFYEIVDDSIVFRKRKNSDREKNRAV